MTEKKLIIGLIDEDAYDEFHNKIAQGVAESARRHNMNVIRFGHFIADMPTSDATQEDILLEFIRQFKLDGLIFLGWARITFNRGFWERFRNIPKVSFGTHHGEVPSVYFRGSSYIKEILHHLVEYHNYKRIAFIEPYRPDARSEVYREIMEGCGLYDPTLTVSESDLSGLGISERGKRAVEILLDERKADVEAIVSLYNEETYEVINTLKARGLRVPEDIAVTSYEDGEICRFLTPGLTTVYFPWRELGYFACEAIYRQLTSGDLPLRTEVPGRVIYRKSCGCIPNVSLESGHEDIAASETDFEGLGENDLSAVAGRLAEITVFNANETLELLKSFSEAFVTGSSEQFLLHFSTYLRKIDSYDQYDEFENVANIFRKTLLPYFLPYSAKDTEKLVWAESMFQQMQLILQDELINAGFRENLEYNNIKQTMKEVGQLLVTNFSLESLKDSLTPNLPRLGIRNCFIYLFSGTGNSELFDDYRPEFVYRGGETPDPGRESTESGLCDFESRISGEDRPCMYLAHLLNIGSDYIGFALIDPIYPDLRIYRSLAINISSALNGIRIFEKLDLSYRRLMEQAHKKGMADTTGILHNIANILNSINVTAQSIDSLLADNAVNDLLMANSLLEKNMDALEEFVRKDPKGDMLMRFYAGLGSEIDIFRSKMHTYIGRLSDKIGLIEGIVNAQQSYTDVKSSLERLNVIPVIEDVLNIHQVSIGKHGIKVERRYSGTVTALAQRTKLFHILTNIIKNAIEAMEKTDPETRILTIEAAREADGVYIRISDRGEGIADGNLENIFAYGFTTKKNGHGFGLHSCANYMTEMKGRIWAESNANGRGATFVLQFRIPSEI